jgi:hypothetical protein
VDIIDIAATISDTLASSFENMTRAALFSKVISNLKAQCNDIIDGAVQWDAQRTCGYKEVDVDRFHQRERKKMVPPEGMNTCCLGFLFKPLRTVTKADFMRLVGRLEEVFGDGWSFEPESISEGGGCAPLRRSYAEIDWLSALAAP